MALCCSAGVVGEVSLIFEERAGRVLVFVDAMVATVEDGFPMEHRRKHNKLFHDNVHRNVYIDSVSVHFACRVLGLV